MLRMFMAAFAVFFMSGVLFAIPINMAITPKNRPACHSFDYLTAQTSKLTNSKLVAGYIHPLNTRIRIGLFSTGGGIVSFEDQNKCIYRVTILDPFQMDFVLTKLGLKRAGV